MMDSSVSLLVPIAGMAAADSPIQAEGAFAGWVPSSHHPSLSQKKDRRRLDFDCASSVRIRNRPDGGTPIFSFCRQPFYDRIASSPEPSVLKGRVPYSRG